MSNTASTHLDEENLKNQVRPEIERSDKIDVSHQTHVTDDENSVSKINETISFSMPIVEFNVNINFKNIKPRISEELNEMRKQTKKPSKSLVETKVIQEEVSLDIIKNKIIDFVKNNSNIKTSDIVENLNFKAVKILEALEELTNEGYLE